MSGRARGGPPQGRGRGTGSDSSRSDPARGGFQGGGRGGDRGGPRGGRGAPRGGPRGGGRGGGGGNLPRYQDQYELEVDPNNGIFTPQNEPLQAPDPKVEERENALIRPGEEISLSGLSLDDYTLPARPSYGTQGRPIVLRTNYFNMLTKPGAQIFRYQIQVSPKILTKTSKDENPKSNRRKTRRLIQLVIQNTPPLQGPGIATDFQMLLFSAKQLSLENGSRTLQQRYYEPEEEGPGPRSTNHQVKITEDGSISVQQLVDYLSSPPGVTSPNFDKGGALQALNIIMTRTANNDPTVYGGGASNKFYRLPEGGPGFDLGNGLVALKGFYTSVRTSTLRILVNINVANGAFYPAMNLLGLMRLHTPNSANDQMSGLEGFISRLRVSHSYIQGKKKIKTVQGFAHPSLKLKQDFPPFGTAHTIKFECAELQATGKISVFQYFKRKWNIELKKPDDPCVNLGNKEHPVFVPPELLEIEPGQQYNKKLDGSQTSRMLQFAVRKPAENARRIIDQGARMMGLSMTNPNLLEFGVKVAPSMLTVRARILPPVPIQYKSGRNPKTFTTSNGSWNMAGGTSFSDGRYLRNWTVVKFARNDIGRPDIAKFREYARNCGVGSDEPAHPDGILVELQTGKFNQDADDKAIETILQTAAEKGMKVLLVFLPSVDAFIYSRVKFWAEVKFGIQTICSAERKIRVKPSPDNNFRPPPGAVSPDYCANIAHKFNLKLGGLNQTLPSEKLGILRDGKTMLVGMDVTHPSPGSLEKSPSIAGVVASIDGQYGQWPASMQAQEGRVEMIQALEEMFGERLDLWQKTNKGAFPERVIVYRDGVSEGQYRTLLVDELPKIREACKKRYPGGKTPKISVIVCGKRHHTRFYPTNAQNIDRSTNSKNGTVVDRGVTMEKGWDFFLQAHTALKGTAKPTHYVVILDENGMNADGLEALTHNLCYLFGRATKAVSLCPPAYYADLLCERGRAYLYKEFNARDNATATTEQTFDWDRAPWLKGVHASLKDTMFYI
ncbi:MAG: hypothetical protein L6R38_002084 [Xanthoria sp. 2 TBL-2021]|nr:MAG: hypothetical protein L6R38_002084 [Xanthoria sp. 2 TBL-2021]